MVSEIKLVNQITKQHLDLKEDTGNLILDNVDWGYPAVTFNNYRVPFQVGETLSGVMVGTREVIITGYVVPDIEELRPTGIEWDNYLRQQKELIEQTKNVLNKTISVYQDVKIAVGEYFIVGRPEQPVKYSSVYQDNNEVYCLFTINILCFDPMFKRGSTLVKLSSMVNRFHFPLIIPENEGIIFGEVFPRTAALVENSGNVPVGCKIIMRAHGGTVRDPKILNVNTGEYIGFKNVTLEDTESIIIDTKIGEETAVKNTVNGEQKLVGKIMEGSTFFQIAVGSAYYFYDMDGSEQNLYTAIEFSENFFNIAEM